MQLYRLSYSYAKYQHVMLAPASAPEGVTVAQIMEELCFCGLKELGCMVDDITNPPACFVDYKRQDPGLLGW
jgi:hypothetical protein